MITARAALLLTAALLASTGVEASAVGLACVHGRFAAERDERPGGYEPDARGQVVIHQIGRDFFNPHAHGLRVRESSIGYGGPRGFEFTTAGFIQDYFPKVILRATGDGKLAPTLLRYFAFHNFYLGRMPFDGGSAPHAYGATPPPGFTPEARLYSVGDNSFNPTYRWIETRLLPLRLEGGNLHVGKDFVLVGDKVLEQNRRTREQLVAELLADPKVRAGEAQAYVDGLFAQGYRPRSRDEVVDELARATGVPRDRVVVVPWMPGEVTGHVDMWVGLVRGRTVAVPYVPDWTLAPLTGDYAFAADFARKVSGWLDAQARALAERGLEVVRLPMVPPRHLRSSPLSAFGYDAKFVTPVNWIRHGSRLLVPESPKAFEHLPPGSRDRLRRELADRLRPWGFVPEFIDVDALLPHNGLLHCLTADFLPPL